MQSRTAGIPWLRTLPGNQARRLYQEVSDSLGSDPVCSAAVETWAPDFVHTISRLYRRPCGLCGLPADGAAPTTNGRLVGPGDLAIPAQANAYASARSSASPSGARKLAPSMLANCMNVEKLCRIVSLSRNTSAAAA